MLSYIFFNNKNSYKDLNLAITNISSLPIPTEKTEEIEVEDRNGSLTVKTGVYEDLKFEIKFRITKHKNDWDTIHQIAQWVNNIEDNNLCFSFRPDKCYKVKNVQMNDLSRKLNYFNSFELKFICEPFLNDIHEFTYELKSNERNYHLIYYNGDLPGECNLKIYGNGNIQLTINNETVQINNVNEYVELDSKLLLCLNKDKTSKTRDMIGHFPLLVPGYNAISWNGNISKIELLPRTIYI
ncbi:distal tail protein Dit [Paeniclostridium hominis]|uniref:distal tail protein Dit n=1 Tax=Paeniclostridium hominis TaxID=2764329 RepID=UPI0022E481B6|nr:distal tail protein Dit [Paeniclostridium hominis]